MIHRSARRRASFVIKVAGAVALVALADFLFHGERVGSTLGLFALAWTGAVALFATGKRRQPGWLALAAAATFGVILLDDPSPLALALCWVAIASAALLTRVTFDDAARWAVRLVGYGVIGVVAPLRDARKVTRLRADRGVGLRSVASLVALPLVGGAVFVALFAGANPLIGNALAAIELPGMAGTVLHLLFWTFALVIVWPSLRPRTVRLGDTKALDPTTIIPDVPLATLTLSLVTFNLLFAAQNALDLVFLWSGAPLPAGVTMAEYAHRGAYALIATALLAGLFVLLALRPGGAGARSRPVRALVTLWVAQNLLLVASSILRTLDYVAAYSLTVLRISALAWMGLVAVGLVLICWRMLAGRSAAWLINANAAAAALVLTAASLVDLGATAAAWNVRHAREGDRIDLCYLNQLGPSALLPLIALERRAGGPRLCDRATFLRARAMADLSRRQADWHGWTWRGARRLAAARAVLGPAPLSPLPARHGRECDGGLNPPPERLKASVAPVTAVPAPSPRLTPGAQR